MRYLMLVLCGVLALGIWAPAVNAQPTKAELKEQFRARRSELRELKNSGRIGETVDGYLDPVDAKAAADAEVMKLVGEENKDRRALYQLIDGEINKEHPTATVKATVETVASRNAQRNIERARPEDFLRVGKDQWIRAKDYPRFEAMTKLKTQGKIGETWEGKVEVVKESDRSDKAAASVVEQENARRAAEYKTLAEKERVDVGTIAQRMGRRNIENARVGDMVKDKDGAWRKK